MEDFRAFVYYSHKSGVYRADCGLFDKPSHGRTRRGAAYNLTRKLKRKIADAVRGSPVTSHYRSHEFCVGMDLVLGGRIKPFRKVDFRDHLGRNHEVFVYHLKKKDLE